MSLEEGPVQTGEGTVLLGIEIAVSAVIAHAVDVSRTGHIRLCGHDVSDCERPHAKYVWLDHPVVGIGVGRPKPIGEIARRHVKKGRQVAEDHQPSDMMAVSLGPDVIDDTIDAV